MNSHPSHGDGLPRLIRGLEDGLRRAGDRMAALTQRVKLLEHRTPTRLKVVETETEPTFLELSGTGLPEDPYRLLVRGGGTPGAAAAAGLFLNLRGQITSVETDRIYPPPPLAPLTPSVFHASLSAYAGGTVTVVLRKNGLLVASLSLGAGPVFVPLTETWGTTDYATLAVTSWAAGARGLIAGVF